MGLLEQSLLSFMFVVGWDYHFSSLNNLFETSHINVRLTSSLIPVLVIPEFLSFSYSY